MDTCTETGKIRYATRAKAEAQRTSIAKSHHTKPGIAYRCPWCDGFHLARGCGRYEHSMKTIHDKRKGKGTP